MPFKPFIPDKGIHSTRDLLTKVDSPNDEQLSPYQQRQFTNAVYYKEYTMSIFDAQALLSATIDTPMTKRNLLPAGQDYIGEIGEPKMRPWSKKDDPSIKGVACDVTIEVKPEELTPAQKEQLGSFDGKLIFRDSIMIDLTPEGGIDTASGKNGKLRMYREALDMNKPGDQFSFLAMQGRRIRFKLKHQVNPDFNNGEPTEQVAAIAKA